MSTLTKYSPPVNRHMTQLDRSFFVTKIPLCVVQFPDPRNISIFAKKFRDYILRVPRIPHVIKMSESVKDGDKTLACDNGIVAKGVLLTNAVTSLADLDTKLSPEALAFLKEQNAKIEPYEYTLDYNYWRAEDILAAVLPEEYLDEIPTGFTITGHIAHLNLRKEFKPFDSLIGQVIMDKNTKITCVVDKVSSIATKFRTFPMKVIAGDGNLMVEQRESNCVFKFDFSKVYWNSRLHTEHDRLVTQYFKPNEVVCDVFAGVGPFAVPAGKKESIVLANDLNPESFKCLQENITLNKVDQLVKPFNLDGAEFIRESPALLKQLISSSEDGNIELRLKHNRKKHKKNDHSPAEAAMPPQPNTKTIHIPNEISHFVMNLPDSAIDFLGNFVGLYEGESKDDGKKMPWIHVHCFEKYGNDEEPSMEELYRRVHQRILDSMHTDASVLPLEGLSFHVVRKVSPTKPMFCVSYKLPAELAYKQRV
ncbi:tRNA (guanine) methyltransferase [Maudiozyma humilis]|uniref:tRNA (guanine(37)-N1)-methyltransferase n=1 Tax=Maudiozyma humilis TaxID=51915 RepID=A0AAV5S520_MAUHU|nr:tRNA (guanine) methyltransferase [Kazachstania humilis]